MLYRIDAARALREYVSQTALPEAMMELQVQQARSSRLRHDGRIQFAGDDSVMRIPGEITIVRRAG